MSDRKGYVMVVEDDLDLRMTLVIALQDAGFKAVGVDNGLDALRQIIDHKRLGRPCLILLDINIPVMSGWELLIVMSMMKEELTKIPIVLVTGENVPDIITNTVPDKKIDVVRKPASINVIIEKVRQHCES